MSAKIISAENGPVLHVRTSGVGKGKAGKPPRAEQKDGGEASAVARGFTAFANHVAHITGRPITFVFCCVIILAWAVSGPIFDFSDTWQLIINTGTTIITFLMVFLIQNTQNRDGAAVQAKLDELIRAVEGARNHFIGIEHLTEDQLDAIRAVCEREAVAAADEELTAALDAPAGKPRGSDKAPRRSAKAADK